MTIPDGHEKTGEQALTISNISDSFEPEISCPCQIYAPQPFPAPNARFQANPS